MVESPHIHVISVSVGKEVENGAEEIIGEKWLRIFRNKQMTQSYRIKKP